MSVLSSSQFSLTSCCGMPTAKLSYDNDDLPRCTGCGHRQPENGVQPAQTRDRGLVAMATEMPNRMRAKRRGSI